MVTFLLFIIMFSITMWSYKYSKRNFLSLTFLSSAMFTLLSFIYIIFYKYIGRDLSFRTLVIIVSSQFCSALGEFIGNKIVFGERNSEDLCRRKKETEFYFSNICEIYISKKRTFLIFLLTLLIAILRYLKLYQYLISNGIATNFLSVISDVRVEYSLGKVRMGGVLAAAYYISLVIGYIYSFLFVQTILKTHKKKLYLLLPVFGYALCVISTTSRSEYIKLAFAFITAFMINYIYNKKKKINFIKFGVWACIFSFFFLWYGFVIRGVRNEGISSIIRNIVSYSSASLYGLDEYLKNPWVENKYFGQYTLNNIYALLGHETISGYEPTFFMSNAKSNIYTSLVKPIQDYGIGGMLISRLILGLVSAKIQEVFIYKNLKEMSYFLWFIFECHLVYIFLMIPIGDKAYIFFLYPKYLLELIISFFISIFLLIRIKYYFYNGEIIQVGTFKRRR